MLRFAVEPKLAAGGVPRGVPTKSPTRSCNTAKQNSEAHWELIAGALMLQPGQRKDPALRTRSLAQELKASQLALALWGPPWSMELHPNPPRLRHRLCRTLHHTLAHNQRRGIYSSQHSVHSRRVPK